MKVHKCCKCDLLVVLGEDELRDDGTCQEDTAGDDA